MPASIVQLTPFLQPFPYGKNGLESLAARYSLETPGSKAKVDKEGGIKSDQPYGEIWFGSHENGPAEVEGQGGKKLKDLIKENPEFYLGKKLLNDKQMNSQYENDLPYLFKVLSFDKPLPLQCHPDKKLGEKLKEQESKEKGKNEDFVDANAKPEVGVALSDYFTAFVGFRPPQQLASIIRAVPEFAAMFQEPTLLKLEKLSTSPSPTKTDIKSVLRTLFDEAINLSPSLVKPLIQGINNRLKENEGDFKVFGIANQFGAEGDANATGETESAAMKRVWDISVKTYGEEDVGVLVSTCMMNLLRMKKGEGAWILADDLHAYVEGDIIECMANSDNMVAHGLGTEEQGGISTFVDMLSYRHLPASKLLLEYKDGSKLGKNGLTRYYKVPIAEFDLLSIALSSSSNSEIVSPLGGPLTFVVTEGTVTVKVDGDNLKLSKGQAAFVKANAEISIEANGGEKAELWGAFYH